MSEEFDNNLTGIARRYAKALLDIASEKNELENVYSDLQDFEQMYSSSFDLKNVLILPTVKNDEKKSIIKDITGSFKTDIVKDFLYLLADEARFDAFQTICYCFKQELNIKKGIVEVNVKSVIDLDKNEKEKLKEKLEKKLQKTVNVTYTTTPDIIGGLVISFEGKTIDLSVNAKFENLKKQLK